MNSQDRPRHAVVTGASSGIGQAIAMRLLAGGWRVTGLCRTAGMEAIDGLSIVSIDVTDLDRLKTVADALAPVDALVHAAGFMRTAPLGELSMEEGAAMWRVHVEAAALLADRFAPKMPAGGRIVLIGSRTANGAAENAADRSFRVARRGGGARCLSLERRCGQHHRAANCDVRRGVALRTHCRRGVYVYILSAAIEDFRANTSKSSSGNGRQK